MARTIGKKNINLVKKLTSEELKRRTNVFNETDYNGIDNNVMEKIPDEIYDTWESAYTEIKCIIDDVCVEYSHRLN